MGEGQKFLEVDFVALERCNLILLWTSLGFGYAAASVIEGYVCAVLVDFAMKSRVTDWEHQSKWIVQSWVCVCVLCMFFSVVGPNKTWQRKFSSDFTRALRKCLFYKLQRPAIKKLKLLWGNISVERGTLQIYYKVLLGQIWMNSDIHFGSTIISHT